MVERRRAWHDITALGLHAQSDDVRCGMTSSPLESTHGRQCRAWHAITVLGQHTRSDDIGRDMPSMPLESTHNRTTLGVACHHRLWAAHTIERCREWPDITALGLHARSDDVGRCMTLPPLDNTHGRQRRAWHDNTTFGQHTRSNDVGLGMPSSP